MRLLVPTRRSKVRRQRAVFERVTSFENRADRFAHRRESNVRHESDAPLVHADQRDRVRSQAARGRQHGSIAADHDRQVGSAAQCLHLETSAAQAHRHRGLTLDEHLAAAILEKRMQLGERIGNARTIQLADDGHTPEGRTHNADDLTTCLCKMDSCSTNVHRFCLKR